jgi:hypothetical protein
MYIRRYTKIMNTFDPKIDVELEGKTKEELLTVLKYALSSMNMLHLKADKLEQCVQYCLQHTMDADEKDIEGLATCHDVFRRCNATMEEIRKWSGLHGPQDH